MKGYWLCKYNPLEPAWNCDQILRLLLQSVKWNSLQGAAGKCNKILFLNVTAQILSSYKNQLLGILK